VGKDRVLGDQEEKEAVTESDREKAKRLFQKAKTEKVK